MTLAFGALPTPQQFQAMILMAGLNLLGIIGEMSIGMMESVVFVGNYWWFEENIQSQKHKHLVCMWLSKLLGIRIWVNERK